ncbi:MAG: PD40 domain-containing protein, partial [Opitutae bacterium]|nr:PD40 domain-containing protein [Opitutae bacterium]
FLYDIATGRTAPIAITLASDFDQWRETWVNKPADFLSGFNLSPDGDRLTLTVRGQVFVAPAGQGRLAEITRKDGVRYRSSAFLPDGKSLLVLSDESGEVEFWRAPANGVGPLEQVTKDGHALRMFSLVSPDGKWLAYTEHNQDLLLYNFEKKETRRIAHSNAGEFDTPALDWSPDGKWLAYPLTAATGNSRLLLYNVDTDTSTPVTSERVNSGDPAFSPDGKWLYFLSDRTFVTTVGAPWGPRQPEPFLDKPTKIYQLALGLEKRSPFQPNDELADPEKTAAADAKPAPAQKPAPEGIAKPKAPAPTVVVLDGLQDRLWEVPVPAGNYDQLRATDKALFATDRDAGPATAEPRLRLVGVEIRNKDIEVATILNGVTAYRLSADGKKLAVQQKEDFLVVDAAAKPAGDTTTAKVNLAALKFAYSPRESWRQMFTDAWRMHRDYYYDKKMHGVDWPANLAKHLPLVERLTDRSELNDLINYLVSELSSLHTDARGGDFRKGDTEIAVATLGARWTRDAQAGGYRLDHIYVGDPDFPERLGPLLKPGVGLRDGDVILEINGTPTLSVPDAEMLLRHQAGRQVLLRVQPGAGGAAFSRVVVAAAATEAANLRYSDWEYTRLKSVAEKSSDQIGYVHLRAMGAANYSEWARNYYANLNRAGLILDLRHNQGGNIDSWIMSRLLRPAWMWWSARDGEPYPNFQNAFRGHLVVLVDAWTASDGETMANGVRHLGLGKIMGVRTWGGGIWLSGSNFLVDRGLARAAEYGSFIPGEGWVVEGDGVTPDLIVDNNPAAAFTGEDQQLAAAVQHLQALIKADPKHLIPTPPPYPDKSLKK